ncbi:MAG: hypothetical protein K2O28_05580 [Clostridia bacterium]|nr:hypothetical protein [Clostridia bacterium]
MKKILGAVIAVVMGATLVGALAACDTDKGNEGGGGGKSDADIAKLAINSIRTIYNGKAKETPASYEVMGQTVVEKVNYDVNWTVALAESCTIENFSNYVSVSPMAEDKTVTINVTKAVGVKIDYTLTATVKVGEASESVSFERYVPEGKDIGENYAETSISFVGTTTRTVFTSAQQVWTANGITLTNDKGSSNTNVDNASSAYHVRIYKGSSVKIECDGMTELVFYSEADYTDNSGKTSTYPAWLLQSLQAASWASSATIEQGTATVNEKTVDIVTVKLATPVDSLEFAASAGQIRLTSLDVVYNKNGASDADKLASAKAALDLTTKNYSATGSYDLPATQGVAAVTWTVTSDYVEIDGGNLKIKSMPQATTPITLNAELSYNGLTDNKEITITLVPLSLEHAGTAADPYSTTDAIQVTKLLEVNATGADEVYVTGYVISPGTYNSTYHNFDNLYIAKTYEEGKPTTAEDAFYVFRPTEDSTYLTASGLNVGDLVVFKGKLQNYKSSSAGEDDPTVPELVNGTCVSVTSAADLNKDDAAKVAAAKENVSLNEEYNTGATVNLPATLNGASLSWTTTSDAVTLEGNTLTVKSTAANGTSVTLNVAISSGDVHDSTTVTFTVKAVNYGTMDAPLSVTEALALVSTADEWTAQVVYMKGIAASTAAVSSNGQYYQTFSIKDENNTNTISVYSINLRSGVAAPVQNDEVIVCGYVTYYKGTTKQFSRNTNLDPVVEVYLESNTRGTSTITLTENAEVAATSLPANAVNGTTVTFTVTPIDGKEVSAVKVNSKEIEATDGNYSFTVTGNTTVVIETKNEGDPDKEYTYTKVTADNASDLIKDGAVIIISATTGSGSSAKNFAMGSQNGNYRNKVDNFDATNVADAVVTVTLKAVEGEENTYYLVTNEAGGGYLTAVSGQNQVKTEQTATNYSKWTISVTSTGTTIVSEGRYLTYNASSPRFAAYGNQNQTAPTLYVQVEVTE